MASTRADRLAHAPLEEVERDDRRDGDHEADRGRDQRLGDAGHDRGRAARLVARQIGERLDDAEHRAEQADERRVVAERAEHAQVALEVDAQARLGAGHRLGDRLGAAIVMLEPGGGHGGGRRALAGQRPARGRRASPPLSRARSSRASASESPTPRRKSARSTMTATDSTDSPISNQSTHSEPSSVNPRIRSVRCIHPPSRGER